MDSSAYDRFNDDNGYAGTRWEIKPNWRYLPDPEDMNTNKGEIYFVGYYTFIDRWRGRLANTNNAYVTNETLRPPANLEAESALEKWLDRASGWLPEWY